MVKEIVSESLKEMENCLEKQIDKMCSLINPEDDIASVILISHELLGMVFTADRNLYRWMVKRFIERFNSMRKPIEGSLIEALERKGKISCAYWLNGRTMIYVITKVSTAPFKCEILLHDMGDGMIANGVIDSRENFNSQINYINQNFEDYKVIWS